VFLLCDSWYPKAEATELVNQFENPDIICSVCIDTVMYGLPPALTGKRGRPEKLRSTSLPARSKLKRKCPAVSG